MKKVALIIMTVFILTACAKVNNNEQVIKDQTVGAFSFKETSLTYDKEKTNFKVTVTNTSSNVISVSKFIIVFKNKNGDIMAKLDGLVTDQVEPNKSFVISVENDMDLSDAYSVEYVIE